MVSIVQLVEHQAGITLFLEVGGSSPPIGPIFNQIQLIMKKLLKVKTAVIIMLTCLVFVTGLILIQITDKQQANAEFAKIEMLSKQSVNVPVYEEDNKVKELMGVLEEEMEYEVVYTLWIPLKGGGTGAFIIPREKYEDVKSKEKYLGMEDSTASYEKTGKKGKVYRKDIILY